MKNKTNNMDFSSIAAFIYPMSTIPDHHSISPLRSSYFTQTASLAPRASQLHACRRLLHVDMDATKANDRSLHASDAVKQAFKSLQNEVQMSQKSDATWQGLEHYFISKKKIVEKALDASIRSRYPETDKICDSMRYSLLAGGKRLRPILVIAACEMFGGEEQAAMPTAIAVEMIHTMSLIHDDLPAMDNDDYRRGKLTNHKVYGEDIAILAGDAMLSKSFEVVAKTTKGVAPDRVLQVIGLLAESVGEEGLAGGQVMDLESEGNPDVDLHTLRWIHTHKTAALLRVSVAAGAILGGASELDVARLSEFAVKIGLAFQIADDVLDCTMSSEELGKTAGKDMAVNKATFPRLMGLDESREEANKLITEAKSLLSPYGEKARALLELANFIVERQN